jgi:hypothetical protein
MDVSMAALPPAGRIIGVAEKTNKYKREPFVSNRSACVGLSDQKRRRKRLRAVSRLDDDRATVLFMKSPYS